MVVLVSSFGLGDASNWRPDFRSKEVEIWHQRMMPELRGDMVYRAGREMACGAPG